MKKIKFRLIALFFTLLVFSNACKEDFLDINESPNALLSAPISTVMTSVTVNIGFAMGSDIHRNTNIIMQQFNSGNGGSSAVQNLDVERYLIQPSSLNNAFSALYSTILADIDYIKKEAAENNSPHYSGVAKICQALIMQTAVDVWGDVPYTEALQFVGNPAPVYDDDEQIYQNIFALIDEGIAEIKQESSVNTPGSDDTFYGGNRTKWEKFANTLKLRMYLHYSEKDPAYAKTQIDALINSGAPFMASIADNFQMGFINAANAQNPIHQFEIRRLNQFFPAKTIVDLMNSKADPRRSTYFTTFPYGTGTYVGAPFDLTGPSINFSRIHTYLRGDSLLFRANRVTAAKALQPDAIEYSGSAPIRILTFAEYNFIRAEASLRFGSPGDAQAFHQAGIKASMDMAGVPATAQTAYLTSEQGLVESTLNGSAAENLKKIIEQKYIANFGVAVEPWSDWRRTGYPQITPPATALLTYIPRSLLYPQSERDSNPENTPVKEEMSVRVFWDTRQ